MISGWVVIALDLHSRGLVFDVFKSFKRDNFSDDLLIDIKIYVPVNYNYISLFDYIYSDLFYLHLKGLLCNNVKY